MAKKPPPGKCVYCLEEHEDLTWDHVFPKAWYPDTTPPDQFKWQVPSCIPCNCKYGKLEEDLLIRMAMSLDPCDPKSAGIVEKGLRAIDPSCARDERDRRARQAKRKRLQAEMLEGKNIPKEGIYPNFGPHSQIPEHQQAAILIRADSVQRLATKIVRGIFYLEDRRLIEAPFEIRFFALKDEAAQPIVEILEKFGSVYAREPGIVVHRAVVPQDETSSVFKIELWGRFKMYAVVQNNDA